MKFPAWNNADKVVAMNVGPNLEGPSTAQYELMDRISSRGSIDAGYFIKILAKLDPNSTLPSTRSIGSKRNIPTNLCVDKMLKSPQNETPQAQDVHETPVLEMLSQRKKKALRAPHEDLSQAVTNQPLELDLYHRG